MDSATIRKVLILLKADNAYVQRALARLKARGLSDKDADAEITRAFLGCLSEQDRGLPNRFTSVLKQIAAGRTTAEVFPDGVMQDPLSDPEQGSATK